MKNNLTIVSKFHEVSSGYRGPNQPEWGARNGWFYRYILDDEHRSSGSFSVNLLNSYREIFNVSDPKGIISNEA